MAQDPGRGEQRTGVPLPTHALDMVPLWSSSALNAEMESDLIRGILESNGIPVLVKGAAEFPNFGFTVQVPRGKVVEAEALIQQAQAAGPDAAAEAEAESESKSK
jgi:hypothetical protein